MDFERIQEITKEVEEILSENPKRFRHSLGVADTAMCLAACHGADIHNAYLAGILHDNAKYIDYDKQIFMCENLGIEISDTERRNPYLLHAKVGAYIASDRFGIKDLAVTEAIKWHTTGKPAMNKLEMIVFIADYIEPMRHKVSNLTHIRRLAFKDLEATVLQILGDTLAMLREKGRAIDSMTQKAYDYYKDKLS